jgi:hypothetical protein
MKSGLVLDSLSTLFKYLSLLHEFQCEHDPSDAETAVV